MSTAMACDTSGPLDASALITVGGTTAEASASAQHGKGRMNAAGVRHLQAWANAHGLSPTPEECDALFVKVKALGNDHCQDRHVKQWFARQRRVKAQPTTTEAVTVSVPPPRATTLTVEARAKLETLDKRSSFIDDQLLELWADLLQVESQVIKAWYRDRHPSTSTVMGKGVPSSVERWRQTVTSWQVGQRPPTPAETASPVASPVLPTTQISKQWLPNLVTPFPRSTSLESSVPGTPNSNEPTALEPSPSDSLHNAIIRGIKEGVTASSQTKSFPKTPEDFNALWGSFESKLTRVAQALKD